MEDVRTLLKWTVPPTPPPSPNYGGDLIFECPSRKAGDERGKGPTLNRTKGDELSDKKNKYRRTRTNGRSIDKNSNTKKCCDRCGTWNHVRRLACTKCLANRGEMGKGKYRTKQRRTC